MRRPSRRVEKATERIKQLVEAYVAGGMDEEAARARAILELRDNARTDWRSG